MGGLEIALPLLVGNGILIALALYERDANVNFKLFVVFGAVWNVMAVIRAFQVGRKW